MPLPLRLQGRPVIRSAEPNVAFRGLASVIDEEQFSPPDKAPPEDKIGRSPLLPKHGRAF